jgi:DNA mismatch endonuclease (patch repair protein)
MARSVKESAESFWRRKAARPVGGETGDIVDVQTRSRMMAAVAQKDTKPELHVRTILCKLGIRYRVRNSDLPGTPDIAHRGRKWAIFVNGCFWHGHKNCRKTKSTTSSRVPKTRADFWSDKLVTNRSRDARRCRELRQMGYRVLILWECDLFDVEGMVRRLRAFCERRDRGCEGAQR